jgi:DNA primase small subunit
VNFRTKQYLRKRFGDYYKNTGLAMPPQLTKREWGFIFFDEMPEVVMRRHKAFSGEVETFEYLRSMVPAHVYHSAAYYQFPGAATMKEKQWQGADLIFDLDADHLPPDVRGKSYKEMLDAVKKETVKLLEFLLDDFGFSEDNISIVFSGGRGYHIHVRDPRVLSLESPERREIVDYIGGVGIDVNFMFREHMIGDQFEMYIDGTKGTTHERRIRVDSGTKRIVSFKSAAGGYGWGKRVSQYLIQFLKDISSKDDAEAHKEIVDLIKNYNLKKAYTNIPEDIAKRIIQMKNENRKIGLEKIAEEVGVSEDKVRNLLIKNGMLDFKREATIKLKKIKKLAQSPRAVDMIKNEGIVDFGGVPWLFEIILQNTVEEFGIKLGAHTDEPVTADVKRLIRMPSSLHGGSGMRVVPITLSGLEKFEPLNDAVVFSEKEIKVEIIPPLKPQNSKVEMKGKSFTVTEGINPLPEYAAIYFMCRGAAEYA